MVFGKIKGLFGGNKEEQVAPEDETAVVPVEEEPKKKKKKMAASAQDLLALENDGGGGGGDGGDWEAAYDESGAMYYVNNATGESTWELPEGGAAGAAEDHGGGQMVLHTVQLKGKRAAEWKKVLEECFSMPEPVSQLHADTGKRVVFPNIDPVSPLVRVNVLEAQSPLRHKITVALGDKEDEANAYWQPVVSFYVFACEMPCTLPYTIELRREPFGTRLRQRKKPNPRDMTEWEQFDPVKGFFAYPEPMPGAAPYFVNWTSGPDRYMVSNVDKPDLGWMLCYRFHGYATTKYHVLECSEPTVCYRVVKGERMVLEEGWRCLFAFYAFDEMIPGTTRYYVQEQFEPHQRIRVGQEPTYFHGWQDYATFCAFDVPMPGASRFSVHFLTQSPETRTAVAEQSRIYFGDAWEPWQQKCNFYAYAAPTMLFD